jgi:ABC-type dipeptide/oligopeptide/nickel transport system permease component
MSTYLMGRLASVLPVLLGVSLLVSSMIFFLPGDPVQLMLSEMGGAASGQVTQAQYESLRHELGLDEPFVVHYVKFVARAVQGDLGRSYQTRRNVRDAIVEQLPSTVQLTFAGLGFAVALGVTLGILAALKPNSVGDNLSMFFALAGVSLPEFWLALMMIFFFSFTLGWVPATGQGGLDRLVLPAVALGLRAAATIARLTRASMLEILNQDYITTARAKGLSARLVVIRHALKNALIPVVTVVGLQFGNLIAGAVIIETVFARQGIGRLAVDAIRMKDFPMIQGCVLFAATAYVLANLLVDLSYGWLDPRIQLGRSH